LIYLGGIVDKFIAEDLQKVYDECVKHKAIDASHYERSFENDPETDKEVFLIRYMRMTSLMKFPVFALLSGFPFFLNPIYDEYYSEVDAHMPKLLMAEYKLNFDKNLKENQKEELRVIIKQQLAKRKRISLIQIPRGTRKTTIQMLRATWKYLYTIIILKQSPTILIAHGDVGKAEENLELIKGTLGKELIVELFSDVLRYETKTKGALRFKDHSDIKRKEHHFQVASVNSELGGKHFNFMALDDWVLEKNTRSPELNEQNKKAFYKLLSLDDRSGYMTIEMVGTAYGDDSLYVELKSKDKDFFHYKTVSGSIDSPKGEVLNFPNILPQTEMTYLRKILPSREFLSQIQQIPYSRDADIHLVDNDDFIFAFADDTNIPDGVRVLTQTKADFMSMGGVITCKDPSYSTKGKSWDSSCSKDTTVSAKIKNEGIFYIEGDQLLGGTTQELQTILLKQVERVETDIFVCDAQGTQFNTAQDFYNHIRRETQSSIMFKPYKSSNLHEDAKKFQGKNNIAQAVLESQFAGGLINVHYKLKRFIKEIKRETLGFDFIDTMVMIDAQSQLFPYLSNKTKGDVNVDSFLYIANPPERQKFRITGS